MAPDCKTAIIKINSVLFTTNDNTLWPFHTYNPDPVSGVGSSCKIRAFSFIIRQDRSGMDEMGWRFLDFYIMQGGNRIAHIFDSWTNPSKPDFGDLWDPLNPKPLIITTETDPFSEAYPSSCNTDNEWNEYYGICPSFRQGVYN